MACTEFISLPPDVVKDLNIDVNQTCYGTIDNNNQPKLPDKVTNPDQTFSSGDISWWVWVIIVVAIVSLAVFLYFIITSVLKRQKMNIVQLNKRN